MKNKSLLVLLLLVISLLAMVGAYAQESPLINISLMNQDPDPVSPGRYVELRFKVFNNGAATTAHDFQVKIDPVYPFTLDPNEVAERQLGDLAASGPGSNAFTIKYKIRVDDKAVDGNNVIKISYKHDNTNWITKDININVRSTDANLAIVSVNTTPENIRPGEKATVSIKIRNAASSAMKDVTLKLDLTYSGFLDKMAAVTAADSIAAFNSMPFAPLGSATEQKIYNLDAGEDQIFTYSLIAYPDAKSKVYKVPIELTYYDNLGTKFIKDDIIGLIVGVKPEMSVIIEDNGLYVGKDTGLVTIKIINKGFSDIKFLNVKTQHTDELDVLSAHEVYIGNVDSDDYETADFNVFLVKDGQTERSVKFPITVEYRDANNNVYSDDYALDLDIISPAKLGKGGGSGGIFIWIILIGAIIAGVYLYRRSRRKKKQ